MTKQHYTNRQLIRFWILDLITDFHHCNQYHPHEAEAARNQAISYYKARHTLIINKWGEPTFTTQPTKGDK